MNLKSPLVGLCGSTILVCIVGLAVSLVPAIVYTDPFWGVRGFVDKEQFAQGDSPGVLVTQIDSGSPAASTGLRERDRVLTVNGVQVEFGTNDPAQQLAHAGVASCCAKR
jgi:S1-C subfamily serine protease